MKPNQIIHANEVAQGHASGSGLELILKTHPLAKIGKEVRDEKMKLTFSSKSIEDTAAGVLIVVEHPR